MAAPNGSEPKTVSRSWRYVSTAARILVVLGLGAIAGAMLSRGLKPQETRSPDGVPSGDIDLPKNAQVVATGEIDVEGGVLRLSPLAPGLISTIHVQEGQRVEAKQPLLVQDAAMAEIGVEQAKSELERAEINVKVAEETAGRHQTLVKQQKELIKSAEAKIASQNAMLKNLEDKLKSNLVKESAVQAARDLLESAKHELTASQLALEQLERTDPSLPVQVAKNLVKQAAQQVALRKKQLDDFTLKAPIGGIIFRVNVNEGQAWQSFLSTPAIVIRPDKPWIVRCQIDQVDVNKVKVGMPCHIYNDRLDKASWQGSVKSCSDWIAQRKSTGDDPTAFRDVRSMDCIIQLENAKEPLRVGQRVRVVIEALDPAKSGQNGRPQ